MALTEMTGLGAAITGAQHNVDVGGGLAFGIVRNVAN